MSSNVPSINAPEVVRGIVYPKQTTLAKMLYTIGGENIMSASRTGWMIYQNPLNLQINNISIVGQINKLDKG